VEGLGGLDLSIGTAIAVKKGAIIAETGIAAGGIAALATVAAGGAVYLLGETIRAAVKGVETPIEVADKYYGTGFADIPGWIERGAASFANEYRKVQFYRRRAQVEGAR